jgi:hypothetical protein
MSTLDQAVFFTGAEDISEDDLGKVAVAGPQRTLRMEGQADRRYRAHPLTRQLTNRQGSLHNQRRHGAQGEEDGGHRHLATGIE